VTGPRWTGQTARSYAAVRGTPPEPSRVTRNAGTCGTRIARPRPGAGDGLAIWLPLAQQLLKGATADSWSFGTPPNGKFPVELAGKYAPPPSLTLVSNMFPSVQ
jgi:hypothetical protein